MSVLADLKTLAGELKARLPEHAYIVEQGAYAEIQWTTPAGLWKIMLLDATNGDRVRIFGPKVQITFQRVPHVFELTNILVDLSAIEHEPAHYCAKGPNE